MASVTERKWAQGSHPEERAERLMAFERQRPRLMGVAYRLLGSVADAEDVVQDAWLRWDGTTADVDNEEAYLTTVVTRLALDRLRRAKVQRETYTGPWLPEPVAWEEDPAAAAELADSLSMALLVVLETMSPLERAAFVLHEVFGQPYAEVASVLRRSEASVRQLVHRARTRVEAGHTRYRADRLTHARVVRQFLAACQNADLPALLEVLAPDVVIVSDGGGVARAPRRPVNGRDKVARLLSGIARRIPEGAVFTLESFNGALGVVARADGVPIAAMAVTVEGGQVQSLHLVANPGKLAPSLGGQRIDIR
jgi:RNA polymerase sigma-70 factor (ECF subfamily)